jgi:hypothetical protein
MSADIIRFPANTHHGIGGRGLFQKAVTGFNFGLLRNERSPLSSTGLTYRWRGQKTAGTMSRLKPQ